MKYKIILASAALEDLKHARAYDCTMIKDKIREHLSHQPTRLSETLIKRLRGLNKPQYRLRVGDYRIFYDVAEDEVQILAIIPKSKAEEWLEREGEKQ